MRSYDVVKKCQDMTWLSWDERSVTTGTNGTFLKSRTQNSLGAIYYKLSCYDRYRGIYGHESINELIASRLLDALDIPHVKYRLIHATVQVDGQNYETWMSESKDYRLSAQRRQPFDMYFSLHVKSHESPLDFCREHGWDKEVHQMMAFDFLIGNRDRHGANIEITFNQNNQAIFSPLFDHGVSFVFSCYDNEKLIEEFDCSEDIQANNYIGSRSLETNLDFLPQNVLVYSKTTLNREHILGGLDAVCSAVLINKIWEFIQVRLEKLTNRGIAVCVEG